MSEPERESIRVPCPPSLKKECRGSIILTKS